MTEQELFDFLRRTSIPNLTKIDDDYSHWDCEASFRTYLGKVDYVLELKCRTTHYSSLLIEQVKWRWLISEAQRRHGRGVYINSTPEGIYAWDLFRVAEPSWERKAMPKSTTFGDDTWVIKSVGYLPVSEAELLR